jgi:D-methionine transport system ATP-binding protein
LLNFDLVIIPNKTQIEKSCSLSFKLKTSSTLVLETKNLSISNKIAKLSSLRDFEYNGKITLYEKEIRLLKNQEIINYRNKISLAGGDEPLFNNISIKNNLVLPLRIRNISEKIIEKRVEELVLWLDLNNIIYKEVKSLNEHELKLLQIVRAIITNPKILILINPLTLNSSFNAIILKLINGLISYKTTLLILENHNYNYQGVLENLEILKLNSVV